MPFPTQPHQGRFARSWRILRTTVGLVARDPPLRRTALALALVWMPAVVLAFGALGAASARPEVAFAALLAILYPLSFVGVFAGVVLVAVADARLAGRPAGLRDGLRVARRRMRDIAAWALLTAGVGVLLDTVVRHIPIVGRVAQYVLGAAWALVTLFAVPVIAIEGCGARACLRRSASIFRARWGEGVIGSVAIWGALTLLTVPFCVALGAGTVAAADGAGAAAVALAAIGGLGTLVLMFVGVVMRELFALALYRYAVDGAPVGGFDARDLEGSLRRRRR